MRRIELQLYCQTVVTHFVSTVSQTSSLTMKSSALTAILRSKLLTLLDILKTIKFLLFCRRKITLTQVSTTLTRMCTALDIQTSRLSTFASNALLLYVLDACLMNTTDTTQCRSKKWPVLLNRTFLTSRRCLLMLIGLTKRTRNLQSK